LLGSDANGMWVPCMAPQILGKHVRSWKQSIILCKQSPNWILIYLLNKKKLSHRASHYIHIFSYGWCSHIELIGHVCGTSSMNQHINHNGYNFSYLYLWLNKVHTFGLKKWCHSSTKLFKVSKFIL
jgi:hypothetical protein